MALVIADRVRETSTTTGTGTLTLAGAVSGFQTFSTAIGNTNTCYYTIVNGSEWEVGLGTVAAGTLARTTVLKSSNAGSAVNFSAGTKDVFATYPADKSVLGSTAKTLGGVGYGDGDSLAFTSAGTAGGVLYSAGGAAPVFSAAGTSGQVLTSAGAGAPTWETVGTTPPTTIGQAFAGGFYAGQIGVGELAIYYLVIAPLSTGQTTNQWKTSGTTTTNTTSPADGPTNTDAMIAAGAAAHPCAQFCNNLVTGGYSDWYMPATNELELCYYNLKPTTTSNTTNIASGTNVNAVASRTAYTAPIPPQTSAAAFQTGGAEAFTAASYWASTSEGGANAKTKDFTDGYINNNSKTGSYSVRAMRRVSI